MIYMLSIVTTGTDEQSSTMRLNSFLESANEGPFGGIAEFIGYIATYLPIVVFIGLCSILLISFKGRIYSINKRLIETLSKNGKYIEGLFVELNDTKELLRYFTNDRKWKKRIVQDYNALFDDEHGTLLKQLYEKYNIDFHLKYKYSVTEIHNIVSKTLGLMKHIRERKCEVPEEFVETASLFEIYSYRYIEKLEQLLLRMEFVKNRYVVLTGSAGNGKTNLLCNLTELLMESGKLCVFINSKDVQNDINLYFEQKMVASKRISFQNYWGVQMLLCKLLRKRVYIIFDAINENDLEEFKNSLPGFINNMLKYSNVRIIVSCRSEYFDLKYKQCLVDDVETEPCCYDILSEKYSSIAKKRMFDNYVQAFNFRGTISLEVEEKLYQQLLLMRMFFEVYKDSAANIISLNKYEVFKKYIDVVMGEDNNECKAFLDSVISIMYRNRIYSSVNLSSINEDDGLSDKVKEFIDGTILLSRKLIIHKDSIRERSEEEIYFVFDEMRDYCIAKYVLDEMCDTEDMPEEDKVISYIDGLVSSNAVCTEGVINYIYWYYKNLDKHDTCELILDRFMKPHDQAINTYRMNREIGLNSWGLRVIFENGGLLLEHEKEYIEFIVLENPGHELSRLFEFLVQQELKNGSRNLNVFFEALFSIQQVDVFCNVLKESVASWDRDGIKIGDFKRIDKELSEINPEGCERFRIYVFLFLHFLRWENRDKVATYFDHVYDKSAITMYLSEKIHFVEEGENDESEI